MKTWDNIYNKISTLENIFHGWEEFRRGKKKKRDVLSFERYLENNIFSLYEALSKKTYRPGNYSQFIVRDPKLRIIHKASVRDRVVHHIASRELKKIFEPTFYAHSYSCRKNRGTHKGIYAFQKMARKVSRNNTKVCWILKCDIKKFFASVSHKILVKILTRKKADKDYLELLKRIIDSFHSDKTTNFQDKKGVPIGNLTSQFFADIYLNELDQFMKHTLKVQHYIRYADDFAILLDNKSYLENPVSSINKFLITELELELHPNKVIFRKFNSGVDFLGYVIFPHYVLPRTKTKRRLLRKIKGKIKSTRKERLQAKHSIKPFNLISDT
ncbi:MAG: reverse transcriptase domain-containing protein [Candidatus Omnitrophica bacterium]|nr:reverse transcriptase domain-containing protein [Candidatus Omnitrophota bacterium]